MKIGDRVYGRYWLLSFLLAVAAVATVATVLDVGLWLTFFASAAVTSIATYEGSKLDTRAAARRAARKPAAPSSGLLPLDEFARICEQYATPEVDPEPELPAALPPALRDQGFVASEEQRTRLRKQLLSSSDYERAWKGYYDMERLDRQYPSTARDAERYKPTLSKADSSKVAALPMVADRGYTATTHCPEGHIGDHWLGEVIDHDDRPMVRRTCRYSRCGATWLEAAWMERAA